MVVVGQLKIDNNDAGKDVKEKHLSLMWLCFSLPELCLYLLHISAFKLHKTP